jgi:hypothetical protein
MSDDLGDIFDNLKQPSAWIRVIFMLAFAIVLYLIIAPVFLVLMAAQFLFVVISGESNTNLRFFGAVLGKYIHQILKFVSYNSEEKPFPFSDFPEVDDDFAVNKNEKPQKKESTAATGKTAAKKAAKKKVAPKKTVAKKTKSGNSGNGSGASE